MMAFVLPAGTYTALRVEIGRAEGHNWFCVLYPALCVGASEAKYDRAEENALVLADMKFAAPCGIRCTRADKMIKAEPHKPGLRVRG